LFVQILEIRDVFLRVATTDLTKSHVVAYFGCFLVAGGAYTPSCLVHTWHNNNKNREPTSPAANARFLLGLDIIARMIVGSIIRVEYAPRYLSILIATAIGSSIPIFFALCIDIWMKLENKRRDREQGVHLNSIAVDPSLLMDGEKSHSGDILS
jgi:hypothetical protein